MQEQEKISESLGKIQILRSFLKSEIKTQELDNESIRAQITVQNTTPLILDGSGIVFTGLALCIIDGREDGPNWISQGSVSAKNEQLKALHATNCGQSAIIVPFY